MVKSYFASCFFVCFIFRQHSAQLWIQPRYTQTFQFQIMWYSTLLSLAEKETKYCNDFAKIQLFENFNHRPIHKRAKNVIIFLGDGMGISTITPSRILKGQLQNKSGEEAKLVFEDFPYISLIKVSLLIQLQSWFSNSNDRLWTRHTTSTIRYPIPREPRLLSCAESKRTKPWLEWMPKLS